LVFHGEYSGIAIAKVQDKVIALAKLIELEQPIRLKSKLPKKPNTNQKAHKRRIA
tara:strand:+ start:342 stop:506 length:165 start_codon:yes stop_codon:yes gene_type:complete